MTKKQAREAARTLAAASVQTVADHTGIQLIRSELLRIVWKLDPARKPSAK